MKPFVDFIPKIEAAYFARQIDPGCGKPCGCTQASASHSASQSSRDCSQSPLHNTQPGEDVVDDLSDRPMPAEGREGSGASSHSDSASNRSSSPSEMDVDSEENRARVADSKGPTPPTASKHGVGSDDESTYEATDAIYRCRQCKHPSMCADCILGWHAYSPYHRIECFNGAFFEPVDLADLGYVYSLRHPGDPHGCPERLPGKSRLMTILDVDGYHQVNVQFCYCDGVTRKENHDEAYQLLEAGLWPQTLDSPRTAITFDAIENFIQHNNTDKKSAYNYCWTLRLMTDPVRPFDVPVSGIWLHRNVQRR